jgi:hypothetical protein
VDRSEQEVYREERKRNLGFEPSERYERFTDESLLRIEEAAKDIWDCPYVDEDKVSKDILRLITAVRASREEIAHWMRWCKDAEFRAARAEEALRFYAHRENYQQRKSDSDPLNGMVTYGPSRVEIDRGSKARAVLKPTASEARRRRGQMRLEE